MKNKIYKLMLFCACAITILFSYSDEVRATSISSTPENDNPLVAYDIPVNSTYTDYIKHSTDVNYYKFTLPQAGYVSIDFEHGLLDTASNLWTITICDSTGHGYITSYDSDGNNICLSSGKIGLAEGTYCIKVEPYNSLEAEGYGYSTTSYTVKVNYTKTSVWEKEDSWGDVTKTPLPTNSKRYGRLMSKSDVDQYQVKLSSNGHIKIQFAHGGGKRNVNMWKIVLKDKNYNKILEFYAKGNSVNTLSTKTGLAAGTYTIEVSAYNPLESVNYGYSLDEYWLKVVYTSASNWETENNDDYDEADVISFEKMKYGNMRKEFGADYDYYQFKTTVPSYLNLSFMHEEFSNSKKCWNVELRSSSGKVITEFQSTGYQSIMGFEEWYLQPGTYYIVVNNASCPMISLDYNLEITTRAFVTKNGKTYFTDGLGKVKKVTGLVYYEGEIYYFVNGIMNKSTTLVKSGDTYWYVSGGKIRYVTTLVKYNNQWYYVESGCYKSKTTLVKYNNKWYYVKNGRLNKSTTLVKYGSNYYYVSGGTIQYKTTLVKYGNKYYFVYNGKVRFDYTGTFVYNGIRWRIVKGVVAGRA